MTITSCRRWVVLSALLTTLSACETSPLQRDDSEALRERVIHANRQQLRAVTDTPEIQVTLPPADSYLEEDPRRREQLDEISGPLRLQDVPLEMGVGLDDQPSPTATLTLQQAVQRAARHNLDVAIAQITPAIGEAELVAAEAIFDAVIFADASLSNTYRPTPVTVIDNVPVGRPTQRSDNLGLQTGIRKPLEAGGEISVSTGFDYADNRTPDLDVTPDPSWTSNVRIDLTQPLLRNFGNQVNRAQILIARNTLRREALNLHGQLLSTIAETEAAYWQLVFARHRLAVQQQLLEMTITTRDRLRQREVLDVGPVQMAQAQAFVERRRAEMISARRAVRQASDELKRLMNDPTLPLADETLLVPADSPIELAVEFSLLDTITSALQNRPEIRQALLAIDDASIRQTVAENQRLPLLNLNAGVQFTGLEGDLGRSYDELGEAEFIDYLLGFQFEQPIGNRFAEAEMRSARLERQLSVAQYRRSVQDIVSASKSAMRELRTGYELIGLNRSYRRASAENLRALLEREEAGEALTPEFLNLKLDTQQRLADAELLELQSIIDYNISLVRLQQIKGTLLEQNQIDLVWPEDMFAIE
ncbi:MAG: TolC family protein [Phycisphaeraceae bacterium]